MGALFILFPIYNLLVLRRAYDMQWAGFVQKEMIAFFVNNDKSS